MMQSLKTLITWELSALFVHYKVILELFKMSLPITEAGEHPEYVLPAAAPCLSHYSNHLLLVYVKPGSGQAGVETISLP